MNIVVFGAGAIGSLFGGLLSRKNNDVLLIGRKSHVDAIKENRLVIRGKTEMAVKVSADDSVDKVTDSPDLLILTVKSYDTESAVKQVKKIVDKDTVVLSLQNGLDNIDKIKKNVDCKQVIAGVTTHGVFFSKPGVVDHTGVGKTVLGEIDGRETERLDDVVDVFNGAGIETVASKDVMKEIWVKAVVNSSINPLTTLFQCKNGYLLGNPLLEAIVEKICIESTRVANKEGLDLSHRDMCKKTTEVIHDTSENYSSMLQSFKHGKKTEIDSINGRIVEIGKRHGLEPTMNEVLVYMIKQICRS